MGIRSLVVQDFRAA